MIAHTRLAISSVVTLVSARHGGHVIVEPFTHAPDLYSGFLALWTLSEGAFAGWVFFTSTLASSIGIMLTSASKLISTYRSKHRANNIKIIPRKADRYDQKISDITS